MNLDENSMAPDNEVSRPCAPRQFSLAGLLSFVLACGLYFGLLTTTVGSWNEELRFSSGDFPGRLIWTIVIGWGGLLVLYCCWKLKAALTVHFIGPMACGILALLALALNLVTNTIWDSVQIFIALLLYGPFVSVLFGFPVVVVMLIYRVLKRE